MNIKNIKELGVLTHRTFKMSYYISYSLIINLLFNDLILSINLENPPIDFIKYFALHKKINEIHIKDNNSFRLFLILILGLLIVNIILTIT